MAIFFSGQDHLRHIDERLGTRRADRHGKLSDNLREASDASAAPMWAGPPSDLPLLVREECRDLLVQIAEKTARIDERTGRIKALAAETDTARRLQTMPGVGPMTAMAVEAFAPEMQLPAGSTLA